MWVFPDDSPEAGTSNSTSDAGTTDLATCAAQHRASAPPVNSGCVWDSISTVNTFSGIGAGGGG